MSRANIIKSFLLIFFILSVNTASAYSPGENTSTAIIFFSVIALVAFLFIMGAVNYFMPQKEAQEEIQDASQDLPQNIQQDESQDKPRSAFIYLLRKSFVIFVICIIICLIFATLNMDA